MASEASPLKATAGTTPRFVPGQTWKHTTNGKTFTVDKGCGEHGDCCMCICDVDNALCHNVIPCIIDEDTKGQCYCGNACCIPTFFGAVFVVSDEGKKLRVESCFKTCAEYELDETKAAGGSPETQEIQR